MKITPTEDQIKSLHKKHAPSAAAYDLIYSHCTIVWEIAQSIINTKQLDVDVELVKAGCLLHDIGTYSLYSDGRFNQEKYITHGIVGYGLLKEEGFDESLCRIASHHTGVGVSRSNIKDQHLPLPDEDFLAETIEEELVMYADKFHSKSPRFNSFESYKRKVSGFGDGKVEYFTQLAAKFGIPDIEKFAKLYNQEIR